MPAHSLYHVCGVHVAFTCNAYVHPRQEFFKLHIYPLHNSIAVSQLDATTLQASVKSCPHNYIILFARKYTLDQKGKHTGYSL